MKIAHYAIVTPRRCGLYETTRELVVALRERGVDSRIVDPKPMKQWEALEEDRGAPIERGAWDPDILVSHSGLGNMEDCGKPIVHVAHGRPRHSFLNEVEGGTPVYSYHYDTNAKPQFRAVVTFWPQHAPYLRVMYPDKPVHVVQAPVDLEHWSPGKSAYDFAGHAGRINVVCADSFRNDGDCFDPLNAFALWARENGARQPKIHVFGKAGNMRGWSALIRRIQDDGHFGILQGWAADLRVVYRKADLVITPHAIDVRTVREAMACGCPVLQMRGLEAHRIDDALVLNRATVRREAEKRFDPVVTAQQFEEILCSI